MISWFLFQKRIVAAQGKSKLRIHRFNSVAGKWNPFSWCKELLKTFIENLSVKRLVKAPLKFGD